MASFDRNIRSSSICAHCSDILDNERTVTEYWIHSLIMEQGCSLCKLILQLMPESIVSQITAKRQVPISSPQKCQLKREEHGNWQVYFEGKQRGALVAVPDQQSAFAAPQSEDALRQIDSRLFRQWMNKCETSHPKSRNESSQRLSEPIDITLVDVIDKRLIRASSRVKFIALSYVWGSVSMFMTTVSNRPELETMGGLAAYLEQIPLLIRDAMDLVQSIGERYLWVDSLCIEQDHPAQKQNQIAHMDIVYGHAFFTVVALSAKGADSPLPGVRLGRRCAKEVSESFRGRRWVAQKSHFSVAFQDSVYETRGWTMQERLFSRRCLYLTEYAAYWSCCQSIVLSDNDFSPRYELCLALQTSGNFSHALDIFRRRQVRLHAIWNAYRALVSEYSRRKLTYSRDTLQAFAGISAVLQESLATRFTSGLPDCFLDIALLWTPEMLNEPMQRNENFASWSWAGWIGRVQINGSPSDGPENPHFSRYSLNFMMEDLCTYHQTPRRPISFHSVSSQIQSVAIYEKETDELKRSWDILCFSAFSVKIGAFEVASDNLLMALLGECGRKCGILYAAPHSPIFANPLGSSAEIILVSENKNSMNIGYIFPWLTAQDLISRPPLCDWAAYPYGRKLLNVMLVTQKGDFAERLCLGCIHEDAWNASNPQKKQIILR